MNTKRITMMLFGVILVLGIAGQAQAMSYQWSIDGTFIDGGTLQGTMDIDHTLAAPVTDFDLTTSGGSWGGVGLNYSPGFVFPTFTYELINTPDVSGFQLTIFGLADSTLFLTGYSPTLNQPGPYNIGYIAEVQRVFGHVKNYREGTAVATPEPASIILFGTGLLGLGAWRYRKSQA